jgi:hypothetical protein
VLIIEKSIGFVKFPFICVIARPWKKLYKKIISLIFMVIV